MVVSTLVALAATSLAVLPPAVGARPANAAEAADDQGPEAPAEHEFRQKTLPDQPLPWHAYAIAAAQAAAVPSVGGWQWLGPTNIVGSPASRSTPRTPTRCMRAAVSG